MPNDESPKLDFRGWTWDAENREWIPPEASEGKPEQHVSDGMGMCINCGEYMMDVLPTPSALPTTWPGLTRGANGHLFDEAGNHAIQTCGCADETITSPDIPTAALPTASFTPCTVCVCHNPVMSGVSCVHCAPAATQAQPQESELDCKVCWILEGYRLKDEQFGNYDSKPKAHAAIKALLAAEHTRGARELMDRILALPEMQPEKPGDWQHPNLGIKRREDIRNAIKALAESAA
jgi:hypothetical protein